jgi:hypothetical protein
VSASPVSVSDRDRKRNPSRIATLKLMGSWIKKSRVTAGIGRNSYYADEMECVEAPKWE